MSILLLHESDYSNFRFSLRVAEYKFLLISRLALQLEGNLQWNLFKHFCTSFNRLERSFWLSWNICSRHNDIMLHKFHTTQSSSVIQLRFQIKTPPIEKLICTTNYSPALVHSTCSSHTNTHFVSNSINSLYFPPPKRIVYQTMRQKPQRELYWFSMTINHVHKIVYLIGTNAKKQNTNRQKKTQSQQKNSSKIQNRPKRIQSEWRKKTRPTAGRGIKMRFDKCLFHAHNSFFSLRAYFESVFIFVRLPMCLSQIPLFSSRRAYLTP